MRAWTLLIGMIGIFSVARALVTRSASIDGGSLMREDEPVIYWFIVIVCVLITAFMFYKTFAP